MTGSARLAGAAEAGSARQFLIAEGLFGAKKLSALMRELYSEDIAAESAKMEEWLRMPPPSSSAALAAAAL